MQIQSSSKIVFSHPDYTVGTGITPVQPLINDKRVMDSTIGRDLHPTPKTFRFLLDTQYSIQGMICQCIYEKNILRRIVYRKKYLG